MFHAPLRHRLDNCVTVSSLPLWLIGLGSPTWEGLSAWWRGPVRRAYQLVHDCCMHRVTCYILHPEYNSALRDHVAKVTRRNVSRKENKEPHWMLLNVNMLNVYWNQQRYMSGSSYLLSKVSLQSQLVRRTRDIRSTTRSRGNTVISGCFYYHMENF